jgi:hypothetical protein
MSIQESNANFNEAKTKLIESVRADLQQEFAILSDQIGVKAVAWTQYTPYFNDGDACEFSVNGKQFSFVTLDEYDALLNKCRLEDNLYDNYTDVVSPDGKLVTFEAWEIYPLEEATSDYQKEKAQKLYTTIGADNAVKLIKFTQLINSIDDSIYLELFGDHVSVIMTPTETIIDEYDHD